MAKRKVEYEIVFTPKKESVIYVIIVSKQGVDLLTLRDFLKALEKKEKELRK